MVAPFRKIGLEEGKGQILVIFRKQVKLLFYLCSDGLSRADAVLKDHEPNLAGRAYFRARYPVLVDKIKRLSPASLSQFQ
jgi:hypothetical protein